MQRLTSFPLPLESGAPPAGYAWSERALSKSSTTTAFNTGIDERDKFLGQSRCVICGRQEGRTQVFEHSYVIPKPEGFTVS